MSTLKPCRQRHNNRPYSRWCWSEERQAGQDVINVQYILALRAKLYDADESEEPTLRKFILDPVAGDIELRTKQELIQKFIESTLPGLASAAEISDSFEEF